jgi:hypothetical protein
LARQQDFIKTQKNKRQLSTGNTAALMWELTNLLYKAKVHPPDWKKKTQKGPLHWKLRTPVFIWLNRVEMLLLLLPHVGWREFFGLGCTDWACYFMGGGAPLTTGWWDPAVCHKPYVNANNLGCDPLSKSEPWFLATMFPNSILSPYKYLPVFSGDFCRGFNY